jgi:hypothetical protein
MDGSDDFWAKINQRDRQGPLTPDELQALADYTTKVLRRAGSGEPGGPDPRAGAGEASEGGQGPRRHADQPADVVDLHERRVLRDGWTPAADFAVADRGVGRGQRAAGRVAAVDPGGLVSRDSFDRAGRAPQRLWRVYAISTALARVAPWCPWRDLGTSRGDTPGEAIARVKLGCRARYRAYPIDTEFRSSDI